MWCNHFFMDQRDAAQATELVRALRERLHEMTCRLVRVERQGLAGTNSPASAIQCEAAELRRDISRAQILVNRVERHVEPRGTSRLPRATRTREPKLSANAGL